MVKVVVRLTRSFQDFVLATFCWKYRWWTTRRALYETWTDETLKMVQGGKWKKFDKKLAVSGRCYKL